MQLETVDLVHLVSGVKNLLIWWSNGGDGGKGGSIILISERNLNTLIDYRYQQHFKAKRGEDGKGKNQTGRSGRFVSSTRRNTGFEEDNKTLIYDFKTENDKNVAAIGGKGGFGNTRFKSSTNRAPRKFTKVRWEKISGYITT